MLLFPAIDLYEKKAVRLLRGDYRRMTVYHENPLSVAEDFVRKGVTHIHLVDLEGAKDGTTPNLSTVREIAERTSLFIEVGGGIRTMETVKKYIDCGVDRVILGTAAVKDPAFLKEALSVYGERIAVGIDAKDGKVAISGWQETTELDCIRFCESMQALGVKTVICTDISKDGAMAGTNLSLYRTLKESFSLNITASGGVSSLDDIRALRSLSLYGAIIGKAYYEGALDLSEALEAAK